MLQIPWNDDDEEIIIESHTSVISMELLRQFVEIDEPNAEGDEHDHHES